MICVCKGRKSFFFVGTKEWKRESRKGGPKGGGVRNGKARERERCLKKWERNEKPLIGG